MAFALVLGLAPVAELPQIRQALRGDAPALSTIAYGLVILRTVPWLPYAIEHDDIALGLWVATCTAVNLTMFMVLLMTRSAQSSRNDVGVDAHDCGVDLTPALRSSSADSTQCFPHNAQQTSGLSGRTVAAAGH